MSVYLTIGETVFSGALTPSAITPSVEIIKTEERSIDGTMNIDVVNRKTKLVIGWTFLNQLEMREIMKIAESTQNYAVKYISPQTGALKIMDAYAGDVSYVPYFEGDTVMWRDVSLTMIEI